MKNKLFTLLLAVAASVGTMFASDIQVNGIWYDFDYSSRTATVTYRGDYYYSYSNEYTGDIVIPASVTYNEIIYSVTSIGGWAFYNCTGLTSVTIGNSVTSIGSGAFYYCSGLTSITCKAITPPTPGSDVFYTVDKSIPLYVPAESIEAYQTADQWKDFTNILPVQCLIASGTCGAQGDNLTWELSCDGVLTISGTGDMGDNASWLSDYKEQVNAVIIADGVTNIGRYAFQNCSSLTSVTIPNSVTSIGKSAFSNCTGLTSVTIPNSVTSIGNSAFASCSLTSVEIPNSVTSIGSRAFEGCSSLTSVTIPNSVTSIGNYAFSDCRSLTSIEFPNSITSIGSFTFSGCSGLLSVTIPNSVTNIWNRAFEGCSNLTSVTIPNSVTSIGNYAFYRCSGLTSIEIPNSVTSIGDEAFEWCSGLISASISNGVTSIGDEAFGSCSSLTLINVADDNPNYCSVEGVLFNKDKTTLIQYPGGKQGAYTIPNSVTSIGYAAFRYCSGLTSIEIPNSVTSIGESAFRYCSGLTSIEIPNSVTSIGDWAFWGCSNLTSITCEVATPPTLGSEVFYDVNTSIPLYVPAQSVDLYKSADQWKDFTNILPIGDTPEPCIIASGTCGAQSGNLTWTLTCDSVLTISGTGEMADYEWNVSPFFSNLSISSVVIDDGVTSIGEYIFNHCSNIKEVVIPSSVTTIGFGAFHLCTSLVTIEIPDSVTSIGESSFCNCTSLTAVTIGSNVTRIEGWAFENNNSLISFTSYCTTPPTIDSNRPAFVGSYLSTCTLYVPAESVEAYQTANGWGVFGNILPIEDEPAPCLLASGTCGAQGDNLTWELSCDSVLTISGTGAMSDYTYSSSVPWYSYRSSIKSVVITDGVTSIGEAAFVYCSGLTSVTIPNSVTSIGEMAFYYCTVLTSVTIPNSVTSIGRWAFEGCTGLTSIDVASDNSNYCSEDGVLFNKDKTTLIRYPGGKQGSYTIPNSVTSIGGGAFAFCKGLTSVTIPNSVTSIESDAFRYCTGLTSVTIPNSVTSIGDWAFSDCSGLTSINVASDNSNYCSVDGVLFNKDKTTLIQYPGGKQGAYTIPNSVTSIGDNAFYNCSSLTSVTIPNSVTSIGEWAFSYCSGLTSVTIPNSVTSIGRDAFYNCSGLTSVTIGNSVTSIGDGAFSGCSGLTSIEIPNSVTSIGSSAFWGCSGLTSVTIGNSVTSIGGSAFHYCTGLTSITCKAITPPTLGSDVFEFVDTSIPLYVPAESVEAYQTADQWKDFTNIIGLDDGDVEESNIRYIDPSNNELGSETVSLHLPDVPEIEGFTFLKWQVVAGDLEEGIIIQTVYQADESTSASSVYTNPANPAQKLIRNGNVYILSNEKTYSITGQEVK